MRSDSGWIHSLSEAIAAVPLPLLKGRIVSVSEGLYEAELPGARLGAVVRAGAVEMRVIASVDRMVTLMPLRHDDTVVPGTPVEMTSVRAGIGCGFGLRGRIIDAVGTPLDGRPLPNDLSYWPLKREAPDPLRRAPLDQPFETGIRVIDGLLTMARGQRVGVFAGPGLGKSTLLAQLARNASADVNVVCLVGERGREAGELIRRTLGKDGMKNTVVVLATADSPPFQRIQSVETAIAVAEWFRDSGLHVLLLVDSITRAVRARRDVEAARNRTLSAGGLPASVLSQLPALLERTGAGEIGAITAVFTVLTETDADPLAVEMRSSLDGHWMLSERLATRGVWPAIDPLQSVSRVMPGVTTQPHREAAEAVRRVMASYADNEELVLMGAYRQGASRDTDAYLRHRACIADFFQTDGAPKTFESTLRLLADLGQRLS